MDVSVLIIACHHQKLKSIQYHAALAIAGAVRGTSSEKLYQELGLESLQQRRWYRKLCTFFKIIKEKSPAIFSILFLKISLIIEHKIFTTSHNLI